MKIAELWWRRRWVILGVVVVLAAAAVGGLALFQPWKLWVDDRVDEAAPEGAVPLAAPPAPAASSEAPVISTTAPAPAVAATATPPTTTTPPTTSPPPTTTSPAPPVPVGGPFISRDHGTSGAVALLQDPAGTQFVRLENLDTSNGPDLFVYLSTNQPDGPEDQFDDDYVNLGRLEGNLGSSNYVIPPGADLTRYASVVIWCDRFDSAFGAAPLDVG